MAVAARFFDAFAVGDWHAMGRLYAPQARFSDPLFPQLDAEQVRALWQMLLTQAQGFRLSYRIDAESDHAARVLWVAHYLYGRRPVVNRVVSEMQLGAGCILVQNDHFNLWRWARQALGLTGWLLGGTPLLRRRLRREAAVRLQAFIARQPR